MERNREDLFLIKSRMHSVRHEIKRHDGKEKSEAADFSFLFIVTETDKKIYRIEQYLH